MSVLGRIFISGLGWAFAGPIGGLIGWWLGGQLDQSNFGSGFQTGSNGSARPSIGRSAQTRSGDFAIAVLVLIAKVLKADGKILKSEVEYVKQYFIQAFGAESAQEMMVLLKNLLEQNYYVYEVAPQINRHMQVAEKLELLHVLFGISAADGQIDPREIEVITDIAQQLKISTGDFKSIQALFVKNDQQAYQILEITSDASEADVKKAYHRMAARFHPDKVSHLGPDFQKMAEDKFKAINQAYQVIRAHRGF